MNSGHKVELNIPLTPAEMAALYMLKKPTMSFSKNCCTGLLQLGEVCGCWRCRARRGEIVNDETEAEAVRRKAEFEDRFRKKLKIEG